ncbi:MAG TPA: 30S ribosome-binding factor RbfA [Firmicutes bacterium]|uniref:Ribosome-binding factor A n=1 Tax=Capillibacterium thermochitinicola TaxID=2699427 RepID=A0A8J6I3K5_9FIRM|nr:30S ribosome-binding factor RbfA [Capillibacterium thermochitinicola]MBA2133844.1 30S ribosome-binding factor RbfA [Capillibacterium thermochitinicola]HHW11639.1 30S ribosome-binding factor RbfA [Bacillota bacterium]
MSEYRAERLAVLIKEELGNILQKDLKDPRIGFASITNVRVSRDIGHAKIYISVFGDKQQQTATMEGLESAKGYIRSELGKRIRMRYVPEISFVFDNSLEEGAKVLSLLNEIKKEGGED